MTLLLVVETTNFQALEEMKSQQAYDFGDFVEKSITTLATPLSTTVTTWVTLLRTTIIFKRLKVPNHSGLRSFW